MLRGYDRVIQALLGGLFTWSVTALGAGLVFVFKSENKKLLDCSLGFAAGVMTAASFWSLISPALEITEKIYGSLAFLPVASGLAAGGFFVSASEFFLSYFGVCGGDGDSANEKKSSTANVVVIAAETSSTTTTTDFLRLNENVKFFNKNLMPPKDGRCGEENGVFKDGSSLEMKNKGGSIDDFEESTTTTNGELFANRESESNLVKTEEKIVYRSEKNISSMKTWRRIMMLVLAITVHNIPEGLAVGVGFGGVGLGGNRTTFENARNLAIGIGIQNFPEGFAVSMPLMGLGYSKLLAFFYGQLSGAVEPLGALLGAWLVHLAQPLLPYALSFAAGAMIFVVFDDIVPESRKNGNGKLASWCALSGFLLMMSLDVGLG